MNIISFIKEQTALCISTLSTIAFGCLGCRKISWGTNTQKTDPIVNRTHTLNKLSLQGNWWKQIAKCKGFSKEWKNLGEGRARDQEAARLASLSVTSGSCIKITKHPYGYGKFLGSVYGLPSNFGMWMPGVALVASYLTEKKGIQGLYVCDSLEVLSTRIEEISKNPSDQRFAFIVGTFQSGFKQQFHSGFEPNFPQHKVTVCVEKKNGQLTIALLDAEPVPAANQDISPANLTDNIWDGYDEWDKFNNQELVFRAILTACHTTECQARLLHSRVLRETRYGCTVFALQDALAYLRDAHFFDKITCSKDHLVNIDQQYTIEAITTLPPEYMVGAQSSRIIEEFRQNGGSFDTQLIGKSKTLQQHLNDHQLEVLDGQGSLRKQNHYITKKAFKYLNLAVASLNNLSLEAIQSLVNKTLICDKAGSVNLKQSSPRSAKPYKLSMQESCMNISEKTNRVRRLVI